jgi:uncharacterized protein YjiS (DUF1127 family)
MKTANIALENEVSNYSTEPMVQVERKLTAARQAIRTWKDRASGRRALRGLSLEMLRDIGVEKYDAIDEADKPFWRA